LTNGAWYGLPWVSCFAGSDAYHFRTGVESAGYDEGFGDAIDRISESASCARIYQRTF